MRALLILAGLVAHLGFASAQARDADEEIAHGHFVRGRDMFGKERYREALAEFAAAQKAKTLPQLDYNIARCHEELGEIDRAIAAYRRYLATIIGDEAAQIRDRIAGLEAKRRARPPVPEAAVSQTPVSAAPDTAARPGSLRPAAWALLGVALGLAATGAGLLISVKTSLDGLDSCKPNCPRSSWEALPPREYAGAALLGLAGAAAISDIALFIVDKKRRRAVRPALSALPGGAALVAQGTF